MTAVNRPGPIGPGADGPPAMRLTGEWVAAQMGGTVAAGDAGREPDFLKSKSASIAEQEVGWTVLRVVVRRRIAILVLALKVGVRAEVQVHAAIAGRLPR